MNDIRLRTGLIIKKGNEYLVGMIMHTSIPRWSTSPYDAWITRDRVVARKLADLFEGKLLLFNPILGQIKDYEV